MITQEELQAIRERAERATPGPWDETFVTGAVVSTASRDFVCSFLSRDETFLKNAKKNAEFIAHNRQDVPALLAEVERLRNELENMTLEAAKWSLKHSEAMGRVYDLEAEIDGLRAQIAESENEVKG